jgi:hypothetical protein
MTDTQTQELKKQDRISLFCFIGAITLTFVVIGYAIYVLNNIG